MKSLPPHWVEAAVSDVLRENIGGVWGKEPGTADVDVSVVRVADFRNDGSISLVSAPQRSITARQLHSRELLLGDVLLEKSGGGPTQPVGRVVRFRGTSGSVVPTNFVQLLRPNQSVVDPGYLFWWLWHSHINGSSSRFQRATTNIRNLRTQDYLAQAIPVPPMNEQRRMVFALEEHFSRLDAGERLVTASLHRLARLQTGALESLIEVDTVASSLGDISEFVTDGDHNPPPRVASGIPHLTAKNIKHGKIVLDGCSFVSKEGFEKTRKRYEPRQGDVLVTCVGSIGKTAVVPHDLQFSADRNLAAIRLPPDMDPRFVRLALSSPKQQRTMLGASGSTAQPHLYLRDLRALKVPIPPIEEQQLIVAEADRQHSLIESLSREVEAVLRRSKALRRSVLERAFDGRLVPQHPADGPASVLLERIAAEHGAIRKPTQRRKKINE